METPAALGKYQVERELGRGATGVVYLAFDSFNQRRVAVKQIHPHLLADERQEQRMRRTLRNEALLAGQLKHPHIVRVYDCDGEASPPYIVLEYIDGCSLSSYTAADKLLPVAQVLDIAFKCCSALEHAQTRGLVHRDIKPANVMLTPAGDVKLADFGTALSLQGDATQMAGLVGSPSYMAPEQVREEGCTHLSDMFSLGVVMYELLTGRRPFDGDSDFSTMYRIGTEEPAAPSLLRSQLPAGLDAIILRTLAKKPQQRYADWSELADELLGIATSLPARRTKDRESERFTQLRGLDFFRDFHDAAIWEAMRLGTLHTHRAGTALMQEDTAGQSFSILLEGSVGISRHGHHLATLGRGVTLGEMAYLNPGKPMRTATAIAESEVVALEIQNEALRKASDDLQSRFDKAFIQLLVNRLIATSEKVA